MVWCGQPLQIIVSYLVHHHNISIVREYHKVKNSGCHSSHGIHVTASEEEVIIKLGVDNLYVNKNPLVS